MAIVDRWTGRRAQLLRQALRLSVREFAEDLGVSIRAISKWEAGGTRHVPRPEMQRILDTRLERAGDAAQDRFRIALSGDGGAGLEPGAVGVPEVAGIVGGVARRGALGAEEGDEVRRRELLSLLAGTAALTAVADTGEDTRRALERVLPAEVSGRDVDEWERSVNVYGVETGSVQPPLMLRQLVADVDELSGLLDGRLPSSTHRRLLRVAVQLSVLTAVTAIAAGAPQAGRRWWRTARRLSGELGDVELDTFVLGQQAVLGMYCGYSQQQVIELTDEALGGRGGDLVCVGTAAALGARAQALSVLGRADEADQSLNRLRHVVDGLPDGVTVTTANWFAHPEYKLRHVESYVNTRLGRTREASTAQEAALRLYPRDKYRGLSQLELHRAGCMIMDGFVEDGVQHAVRTLRGLPAPLRDDRLVHHVAQATATAVPVAAQAVPSVGELRRMLALSRGTV